MGKGASKIFGGLRSILNMGKLFKGTGGAGWIFGLILLASLFKKKKAPDPVAAVNNYESPTYSFGGGIETTVSTDNAPIPLVFGKHVVGGNIVNSYIHSNSSETKMESLKMSSTSLVYVSHSSASGTSVYKVVALPTATSLDIKLSVPVIDLYTNTGLYNAGKNATVEIYYSVDGGTSYILSNKIPFFDLYGRPANLGYSSYLNSTYDKNISIPLDNDAERDIYLKTKIVNFTYNYSYMIDLFRVNTTKEVDIFSLLGGYTKITEAFYYKPVTVMAAGSVNQKLRLDVVLSGGEIRNLRNVFVNDRPVYEALSDNKRAGAERNTSFRFRPGFDSIIDMHMESTLTVQSTIYNQNDVVVDKWTGTTLTADTVIGDNKIYLDNTEVFASATYFSVDASRLTKYGGGTITITGVFNEYITISQNFAGVMPSGTPIYLYIDEPVTYIDFQYSTQGEQIDGVVIGLNASEGLYNTNQETGALLSQDVQIHVKVCPTTLSSGSSATFPLTAIDSAELLYDQTLILRGNRRAKLWFDQIFTNQLVSNPDTLEKKYLIEVRKLTDTSFSEYTKNTLQVAYVEELVNRELAYNGCSYVGMEITANAKVNGGTPNLRFEVDGMLVPRTLPESVMIDTASSTASKIVTKFNTSFATSTNYTDAASASLALSGFVVEYNEKLYSLLDDQNLFYAASGQYGSTDALTMSYNHFWLKDPANPSFKGQWGWQYFKAYFKCGDLWYRRFVTIKQELIGSSSSAADYRNYFEIIDFDDYLNLTGPSNYVEMLWLIQNNTALPSVPTDVILYQWSDNPAWVSLFLLCDENNGAGVPFDVVDLDSFREAANYYDEHIDNPVTSIPDDKIKRCSINLVLDAYADLRTQLEKILTISHGAIYNSHDKIKFIVERKMEEAEIIVELDEEVDLTELSVSTVPSKDMPNQLAVTFLDENDNFTRRSIIIEDASLSKSKGYQSINKKDIDMFGLTNESLVFMESMKIIKAGRYTKFGIQFKSALSGSNLEVYDVFKLTAPTYGWVDKKFRVIDIKSSENTITDVSAIEYFDAIYDIDSEDLINYHEVSHTSLPSLTEPPLPVKNLVVFEEAVRNNSGNVQVNLVGNFTLPEDIIFNENGTDVDFDGRYIHNKTSYVLVTLYHSTTVGGTYSVIRDRIRFDGSEIRFNNLEIGSYYKVAIESASLSNAVGSPVYSTPVLLEGKKLPPLDVTAATWERYGYDHSKFRLQWTPNTSDFDLASYVIRFATATGSWDTYEYQEVAPANQRTSLDFYFAKSGGINNYGGSFGEETDTNFQIIFKCLDTSGNYSLNPFMLTASATLEPDAVSDLDVTYINSDNDYPFIISWTKPTTDNIYQYMLRIGSASSSWATAEYSKLVKAPSFQVNSVYELSWLFTQSTLNIMVKAMNMESRFSTSTILLEALTLEPTTPDGGTLALDLNGVLWFKVPTKENADFQQYETKVTLVNDPACATAYTGIGLIALSGASVRYGPVEPAHDGVALYGHYRALDTTGHYGVWNSSATLAVDVIPAHVSSTDMKYKVDNVTISLLLPNKSQELSWEAYEVHISSASGFTPELNATSTTIITTGRTNQFEVKQFRDGTALNGASTYYIKVRSLSKYAPNDDTYHSDFSGDLTVITSDAENPVLIVNAITPSISPINVIIGDTIQVDYQVSDNGTVDRTRGRVYHADHVASATWIDPIDVDSHTFDLFPSSTDGNYILQLTAFDTQGNYSNYTNYFSRDTATATEPISVTLTQSNNTGVLVVIDPAVGNINLKEYVVDYAINTGGGYSAWAEIRRTNSTAFTELIAVAGTVKFRVKVTKIHTTTLDSIYTESNELSMDAVGPTLQIDYTTPDIFLDSLLTADAVTFHFLTNDSLGLRADDPVVYSLDSGVFTSATTAVFDGTTAASGTVALTGLSDGSHYITFRAYDTVGNTTNTSTYYFEVDSTVPADLDAPTITVNGRTITITVPDFTPDTNFNNIEYQIYDASDNSVIATFNK